MENQQEPRYAQGSGCLIHILRHGQSLHNVNRDFKERDPSLTETGVHQASGVKLPEKPDLIIVSPMTRTIQTVKLAFTEWLGTTPVQVWPDLREAHDGIFNHGVSRDAMAAMFPQIDFSECPVEWGYPAHSFDGAVARAERVRQRLKVVADSGMYQNIYLVSHRGFIAFLVQGERFNVCDLRTFRFASEEEVEGLRFGINVDSETTQDFGPTVLRSVDAVFPLKNLEAGGNQSS